MAYFDLTKQKENNMSSSVNKVILLGTLGNDPETRTTGDGRLIANFSIATNSYFKDDKGEKQQSTEWHRVVAFGKKAKVIQDYVKKGHSIHIIGSLQTRKWTDDKNVERYSTEIVADEIQLLNNNPRQQ